MVGDGLILVALGAMRGMQTYFLLHPQEVVGFLALAFAINAGFQVLGATLFASAGRLRTFDGGPGQRQPQRDARVGGCGGKLARLPTGRALLSHERAADLRAARSFTLA